MSIFIVIGIILLLFVGLVLLIKHHLFMKDLYWHFQHVNVIVFGKKGSGKDLVTHKVIKHRKDFYYANIPYTADNNYEILEDLNKVSCEPNDYKALVNNDIKPQPHRFKEGKDIYISDMGVYLPSYMDSTLYKLYPSMPVLYALSRQLYSQNIHFNTQALERGWKALREQADFFVRCKRTYKLPFILLTKVVTYEKYASAQQELEPIKTRMLNKYSKAEVDMYKASNGDIKTGFIIQLKKNITYDTRYFEKKLLTGERLI